MLFRPSRTPRLLPSKFITSLAAKLFAHMKRRAKEFFPGISKIQYEGPKSKNPLAFKHYNPDELVEGRPMKDHLRFSVVYWHTFRNPLADPFGVGTAARAWRLNSSRSSARRFTPFTTAMSRPKARTCGKPTKTWMRSSRC